MSLGKFLHPNSCCYNCCFVCHHNNQLCTSQHNHMCTCRCGPRAYFASTTHLCILVSPTSYPRAWQKTLATDVVQLESGHIPDQPRLVKICTAPAPLLPFPNKRKSPICCLATCTPTSASTAMIDIDEEVWLSSTTGSHTLN